jgi:hypothetical protein
VAPGIRRGVFSSRHFLDEEQAELHEENKAFRLSGAKIDFSKSKSKLW